MSDDIFHHFDAWEPLIKARKAKGLDKWAKLRKIADKLTGKNVAAIAFTCSHPSHQGEPVKHLLGSVEGNLHFLLGYGNPGFHFAPYHIQIIDPNTTDDEAQEAFERIKHPSNPDLWAKSDLNIVDEGDLELGEAHDNVKQTKSERKKQKQMEDEALLAVSPAGQYVAIPSEGIVRGLHNNQVYRWDFVKDTFFSAQNPAISDVMNEQAMRKGLSYMAYRESVPDEIRVHSEVFRGETFTPDVWPLVKSRLPVPGSILRLESNQGSRIYGVVTPTSIDFYNKDLSEAHISVFDRVYKSFDLTRDGNVPPAALASFIIREFNINTEFLNEIAKSNNSVQLSDHAISVEGMPSPGFDDIPSEFVDNLNKSIELDGDTLRLVVSL